MKSGSILFARYTHRVDNGQLYDPAYERFVAAIELPADIGNGLSSLLDRYGIDVTIYPSVSSFLAADAEPGARGRCVFVGLDPQSDRGHRELGELCAAAETATVFVVAKRADSAIRRAALDAGATDVIEYPLIASYLANRLSECAEVSTGDFIYRAMLPEDAALEQAFVRSLSERSRYLRFFSALRELSPRTLYQFTHTQFPESHALVAAVSNAGRQDIVAVARYAPGEAGNLADFAVVVADRWQGQGLAARLLRGLMAVAAVAGRDGLQGMVLKENTKMLKLSEALGFERRSCPGDSTVWIVRRRFSSPPGVPT